MENIILIGFGWAVQNLWLPQLTRMGSYRFLVYDPHIDKSNGVLDRADIVLISDLKDISNYRIILGIVASPNVAHFKHTRLLLENNINVIVEKPICLKADELTFLMDLANANNVSLIRSNSAFYDPHFKIFIDLFRGRESYLIQEVTARWMRNQGIPNSRWLISRNVSGAGSSIDLGSHLLECALNILAYPVIRMCVSKFHSSEYLHKNISSYANWYGCFGYDDVSPDVDTSSQIFLITEPNQNVTIETDWCSDTPYDFVEICVKGSNINLTMRTLFGMSHKLPERAYISGRLGMKYYNFDLPRKKIGVAHIIMIDEFIKHKFNMHNIGQTHLQHQSIVSAIERIYTDHVKWSTK